MRSVLEVAVTEAAAGQAVATHLSGGLDSGVITALAQRFSPDGLRYVSSWTPPRRLDSLRWSNSASFGRAKSTWG